MIRLRDDEDLVFDFEVRADATRWDSNLLGFGLVHPFQTTAFGEYMSRRHSKVFYVDVHHGGRVIGKCCVYCTGRVASWHYGPVVSVEYLGQYRTLVRQFIEWLRRQREIVALENCSTQPMYGGGRDSEEISGIAGVYETPYIDLRQDLEVIHGTFHAATRKNLRKCEKANVQVEISREPEAVETYLKILRAFRSRMGSMPTVYPSQESMAIFCRPDVGMDVAVASVDDVPLAGLGFITFGGLVVEVAVATAPEYQTRRLAAQELIKARVIEHYKKQGLQLYDLSGIRTSPRTEKEANIRRFKLKFTESVAGYGYIERQAFRAVAFFGYRVGRRVARSAREALGAVRELLSRVVR